jgi:hypothetical protein
MAHFSDSNLTLVLEQVKQEIHVDSEGKGKASIRAVARLVDVSDSSIWRAFQGAAQTPSKLAETLIEQGFEGAAQVAWKTNGYQILRSPP